MSGKMDWQKNRDNLIVERMDLEESRLERLSSIYESIDNLETRQEPFVKKNLKVFKGGYKLHYVHQSYLDSNCLSMEEFEKKFRNRIKKLTTKTKKEYPRPVFTKFFLGKHHGKTYQHVFENHFFYFMWHFWIKEDERLYMIQNIDMIPHLDFFFEKAILDD
jgi:hypothetical protein